MLVADRQRGPDQRSAVVGRLKRARQTGVLLLAGLGLEVLPREAVFLHEHVRLE